MESVRSKTGFWHFLFLDEQQTSTQLKNFYMGSKSIGVTFGI